MSKLYRKRPKAGFYKVTFEVTEEITRAATIYVRGAASDGLPSDEEMEKAAWQYYHDGGETDLTGNDPIGMNAELSRQVKKDRAKA